MGLTLLRDTYGKDGVLGALSNSAGVFPFRTLEHAYPSDLFGGYYPKVPAGKYTCKRGKHRLHGMTEDFETFEIQGVVGHSNILFHWGNFNSDSEGCVLVGMPSKVEGLPIANSRKAFAYFMQSLAGLDEFELNVVDAY